LTAPAWTTACPDWADRVVQGRSLIPFKPLFPKEAKDALRQFNALQIVDAPGSPRIGEASKPWVGEFAGSIFGAYDPNSGRRLIQEFFLLISKKNWKSGLAASIMLTALVRNWRRSAEFLIVAPTVEIANNSFYPARDMVRANEDLAALMHVQEHVRTITHLGTGATLKVVAADNEAVGGKKATGILVDELWIFGKQAKAENMLREATGGLVSRPEGFVIYLSTQSDEPPAGVFKSKLSYARRVRDGEITDPKFLPVIYEFPKKMLEEKAYLDPANFHITNPNLDASVDAEFLVRNLAQAQEGDAESMAGFLAKHLNVEIGLGLMSDRWAGADFWQDNKVEDLSLDDVLRRSDVITVGLDGGGLDDLFGMAVIGRERETGLWLHWGHAWAHPIVMERRKGEASRLRDFIADGDLTLVESIGEDVADIVDLVRRCDESGLLDKVGVDPAGIGEVYEALTSTDGANLAEDRVVGISQGWKMMGAIKTAERRLAEGSLKHGGAGLMAWAVSNAKVEPKGNAVAITKQVAGKAKIDPLMALFNAVELMSRNPAPRATFVTDELMVI
jgi:phage terminase large subunit-like protein